MRALFKASMFALALAPFISTSASAQAYRWDATLNGGYTLRTSSVSFDNEFFFADELFDEELFDAGSLHFNNSWMVGAQLGYWFTRQIGLRANMTYSAADFRQSSAADLMNDVNMWGGTGDVMIRFSKPREKWDGKEFLPYAALGLGAHWTNPPGDGWIEVGDGDLDFDDDDFFNGLEIEGTSGVPIVCRLGVCAGPNTTGFPGVGTIPRGHGSRQ